jgi:hypothetical protein
MTSQRAYFGMLGLIVLLAIGLIFGSYEVVGLMKERSNNLVNLKIKQQSLNSQESSLVRAKKDIKKYANLEQIAKTIVPQDKDQAEAVREIVKIAGENGITLSQISFPNSSLGSGGKSNSKISLSQLTKVPKMSGVYQLPITLTQSANQPVPYSQFINFLKQLEQNRRTAQVTSVALHPDDKDPGLLSFSLTISEYIKP